MNPLSFANETMENGPWKGPNHWVSHYNYMENGASAAWPKEIVAHDSTLRDGEQAPTVSFSTEQKIDLARQLDEAGIQYIEAGFPPVSEADTRSVAKIASMGLKARITCLARAMEKDIDLAVDCGVWGAILEVPIGYPRLMYQFEWSEEEVLKRTFHAIEHAHKRGLNLVLFFIDTARVRGEFLHTFITRATQEETVKRIAIVDTLGAATPEAITAIVRAAKSWTDVPLEMHCHNDFGLGVINTIAGLKAGAEVFSGTINGLGQRAGNAPVEDVIMAMHLLYGIPTTVDLTKLRGLSAKVQELSGVVMPQYKSVVGDKLFEWEAGIPTAALRKLQTSVEPYTPEVVGAEHTIVLGKKSGKANIQFKLEQYGLSGSDTVIDALLERVKARAVEKNCPVTDEEFLQYHAALSQK